MKSAEQYVKLAEEELAAKVFNAAAVYATLASVAQAKENANATAK